MRKAITLAALAATLSTSAHADTLKAGYPLCVDQGLLGQAYDALLNKDAVSLDYLFGHGCFETKAGVRVSVIGWDNWGGEAHVRIYSGKEAVEAWTSMAAIDVASPSSSR